MSSRKLCQFFHPALQKKFKISKTYSLADHVFIWSACMGHHEDPDSLNQHPSGFEAFVQAVTPLFSTVYLDSLTENVHRFSTLIGDDGAVADWFLSQQTTLDWIIFLVRRILYVIQPEASSRISPFDQCSFCKSVIGQDQEPIKSSICPQTNSSARYPRKAFSIENLDSSKLFLVNSLNNE